MKNIYLLIIALGFISGLYAQPVINQNNYPAVGDTLSGTYDFSAAWNSGASGINATWDFSTLSTGSSTSFPYIAPSSTPYAATFASSNLTLQQLSVNYSYFISNASAFEITGIVTAFPSAVIRPFTDPQKIITFPFTYLNNFKDTARTANYNVSGGNHQRRVVYSETKADAYGSLQLPGITYNNVLRLLITSETIDSTFNSGNVFQNRSVSIDTNYYWISEDRKPYLLVLSKNVIDNGTPTIFAQYFSDPTWPTGIKDQQNIYVNVYPNPADNFIRIDIQEEYFNSLSEPQLILLDQQGKEVYSEKISSANTFISRNNLPSGIYFYKISSDKENISSGKISVK
ncbi:MAG: T9SS type A sorting domain-containing protein [Cytophagaceae bacterium]|nr:T9SS type A sorting domain-containing protein [Cytophagaceae bacterium]